MAQVGSKQRKWEGYALTAKAGKKGGQIASARMTAAQRSARAKHAVESRIYARGLPYAGLQTSVGYDVGLTQLLADGLRRLSDQVLLGQWDIGVDMVPLEREKPCRAGVASQLQGLARRVEQKAAMRIERQKLMAIDREKAFREAQIAEWAKEESGETQESPAAEAETGLEAIAEKWGWVKPTEGE